MSDPGVKSSLLVEYRCRAKGCLLLRVWQTPHGPEFVAPGRQLSSRYALARTMVRINITGGEMFRNWAGRLDDWPELPLLLMCEHVIETARAYDIRRDLEEAGGDPRARTQRRTGTRGFYVLPGGA